MNPKKDTVATDAFFEKQPNVPVEPQDEAAEENSDVEQRSAPPFQDYVRELQQEFEEQEEEGKI